jgi:peptidoglycan/LPS O-acetylase OafA/YrhL
MPQNRLSSLDGLRAVSIILVLGDHVQIPGGNAERLSYLGLFDGALGVRIFFVISGFIITYLFVRESDDTGTISIPSFYLRRFLRLYPVNVAFVAFLFLQKFSSGIDITGCQYLTALTYTKNFACAGWMDGHLWSLAVEEQFYLVWPLLFFLLRGRGLYVAVLALIAIAPFSRALEYQFGSRLYALPTSNSDALMIGCLLALLFRDRIDLVKRATAWHPAVGRTLAVLLMYVPIALSWRYLLAPLTVTLGPMLQAACAGYLIASLLSVRTGISFSVLNFPVMRGLGLISYSLYIWQQPFLLAPAQLFGPLAPWLGSDPGRLAVSVGCAILSYFALERPLVALRQRLHPARRRRADLEAVR